VLSIVRIRVSSGATEPLASLQNERPALTGVGIWTGLAPGGSLLTLRDLSTQEPYSVELSAHYWPDRIDDLHLFAIGDHFNKVGYL